jgi:hypothetical protein
MVEISCAAVLQASGAVSAMILPVDELRLHTPTTKVATQENNEHAGPPRAAPPCAGEVGPEHQQNVVSLAARKSSLSLSGNGGFTIPMEDFMSLKQLKLPVKVVVFKNGTLGFIELAQKSTGFLEFGTELDNPNAMAEIYGASR